LDVNHTPPPVFLLRMMTGYWVSKALSVVAELGVADLLADGPRSSDDLATACGAEGQALYRLLRALASVEVFQETAERRFRLTPLAELLRSDHPQSMRALARMYGSEQYSAWGELGASIRTGSPAFDRVFGSTYFEYLADQAEASAVFNQAMTGWTAQLAASVVAAYEFAGPGVVVDVGGGHGLLLSTIVADDTALNGVLFDLPHVVESAKSQLEGSDVSTRCSVVAGDFFEAVPDGGSFYILAQILHDWDDDRSIAILRNCRRAMNTDAKLLVVEQVLPSGNEPSLGKWLDLHMLVLLNGRERTEAEYAALLAKADLEATQTITTSSGASIIEAIPV